jgi:hypothetical protein
MAARRASKSKSVARASRTRSFTHLCIYRQEAKQRLSESEIWAPIFSLVCRHFLLVFQETIKSSVSHGVGAKRTNYLYIPIKAS